MLMGPSDMYGDLSIEDVDGFEGLQVNTEKEINPEGLFQRAEFRSFDQDFERDMDHEPEQDRWGDELDWPEEDDDENYLERDQELMDLYGPDQS